MKADEIHRPPPLILTLIHLILMVNHLVSLLSAIVANIHLGNDINIAQIILLTTHVRNLKVNLEPF